MLRRVPVTRSGIVGSLGGPDTIAPGALTYRATAQDLLLFDPTAVLVLPGLVTYGAAANPPSLSIGAGPPIQPAVVPYSAIAQSPVIANQANGSVSPAALAYAATASAPTVDSPTPVSSLNAIADTGAVSNDLEGSFAVSAGSNRGLVYMILHTGAYGVTAVSYGGQAMTELVQVVGTSGFPAGVAYWFLNDVGIAAASGTGFETTGTVGGRFRALALAVQNVNQGTPVRASAVNPDDINGVGLNVTSDPLDFLVALGNVAGTATYTWSGATEGPGEEGTSTMNYSSATGAGSSPSATVTPTVVTGVSGNQQASALISLQPA